MTVEAALTKLSYLLGRPDLDVDAVREVCACDVEICVGCDVCPFPVYGKGLVWGDDSHSKMTHHSTSHFLHEVKSNILHL